MYSQEIPKTKLFVSHPDHLLILSTDAELEPLVTSNTSGLTYKNLYCGLCNNESTDSLDAWSWNFDCFPNVNAVLNISGSSLIDNAK